jgi:hypothetical protein
MLGYRLAAQESPGKVGSNDPLPLLKRQLQEGHNLPYSGTVDQNVNVAQLSYCTAHHVLYRSRIGHINLKSKSLSVVFVRFLGSSLGPFYTYIRYANPSPLAGKSKTYRPANTTTAACDQSAFTVELHGLSLLKLCESLA